MAPASAERSAMKGFILVLLMALAGGLVAAESPTPPPPAPDTPTPTPRPAYIFPTAGPTSQAAPVQALVPLTASAASQAALAQATVEDKKTNGFYGDFGLSQYLFFNGQPLSYNLGVGYEFESGLRLRTALENFYYEGREKGVEYSYTYNNWSSTADFCLPALPWLRPLAGISLDMIVNAQRSLRGVTDAKQQAAPSFIGAGLYAGLLYRATRNWELQPAARFISTFSAIPNVIVVSVDGIYHFR
jgi:hypothetical protein